MNNNYGLMMLVVMLGITFYVGIEGAILSPKARRRSADRIMFRNRWYPSALAIYAVIGIISNFNLVYMGQRGVSIIGLALFTGLLATLLVKRGLLFSIINIWLILAFLSAIARSVKFIQGTGSAGALREVFFSLLVAGFAYVGKNAYGSYCTAPMTTKGDP